MAIIKVDYGNIGNNAEAYAVVVAHKTSNETKVYTGVTDVSSSDGVYCLENLTATDEHTTGPNGGTFDFTITISPNFSLRLYGGAYNTRILNVDLIKNGTTIVSGMTINLSGTLNSAWSYLLVVT